jgi:tetratricopeptide (TPR) repeat protein
MRLRAVAALLIFLSTLVNSGPASAQNTNALINMFSGIMQTAMIQAAQAEWRKISPSEIACIDQSLRGQGLSVLLLMQHAISPLDPRLSVVRSTCRNQFVQQPSIQPQSPPANLASSKPGYSVDGLTLGGRVQFDSAAYRQYQCRLSEQFPGFTWCQKSELKRETRGSYTSSVSILHSSDGTAQYVNRFLEPAFFNGNEANEDIERRSKTYGTPRRVLPIPQGSSVPYGMIAVWGDVVLERLDGSNLAQLAAGREVHVGILIDHIGNYQRSARQGLPIYRLTGGPGYIWAASWNQNGLGTLRFLAIDPSLLMQAPPTASSSPSSVPGDPWKDCQSNDADIRLKGCTLVINTNASGSRTRLADALDGRCSAYDEKRQYDLAVIDCKAAIEQNPRYSYAYNNLGQALFHLNDYKNAITAFDKAIELKPDFIWSRLGRASVLSAAGDDEKALKDYQYALFLDPTNQGAISGLLAAAQKTTGMPADPSDACISETTPGNQRNGSRISIDIDYSRRIDEFEKLLPSLDRDAQKMTEFAQMKLNESIEAKQDAERQRAQLAGDPENAKKMIKEVENLAKSAAESQSKVDEGVKEIAERKQQLEVAQAKQQTVSGKDKAALQRSIQTSKDQISRLQSKRVDTERRAQAIRLNFIAAKDATEQRVSNFARTFLKAERIEKCANDALSQAKALTQDANELREKMNQEKLRIAREASELLVSDLSNFSRSHPKSVPIEIAGLVLDLKSKLKSDDMDGMSQARITLENRLNEIDEFRQYIAVTEQERRKIAEAHLRAVIAKTRRLQEFTDDYVRSNITSDAVETLLKLNREMTDALADPSAVSLTKLVAFVENELTRLDLGQNYATFVAARMELKTIDTNRYLIEGPSDENLILANDTGRAPVVRGLKGDLIFDEGKADVCFANVVNNDLFTQLQIKLQVRASGAREIAISQDPCDLNRFDQYDVIVVDREELLNGDHHIAQALLDSIERNELSKIASFSHQQVEATRDAEKLISQKVADEIEQSQIDGFGIVYTSNHSPEICRAIEGNDDVNNALIAQAADRLEVELKETPRGNPRAWSIENAFIAVKRGQCGSIYGNAETLKSLMLSLKRDKIDYQVLPVWFSREAWESEAKDQRERAARVARNLKEIEEAKANAVRIAAIKNRESGEERRQREKKLREEYGASARAMENIIADEIKAFVEYPRTDYVGIQQKYREFALWYKKMLNDQWELVDVRSELDDYGVSIWKNRVLETGFINSKIRMKNRMRGENQESCFEFGFVLDREFEVARDAVGVACEDRNVIARYKKSKDFSSRWNAN